METTESVSFGGQIGKPGGQQEPLLCQEPLQGQMAITHAQIHR